MKIALKVLLCAALPIHSLCAQISDAGKWREDLRVMAQEMPKYHKDLFHTVTRLQFDSAVASLSKRIPQLTRHQIIVEMARIAAMIGDGHTNIAPSRDPKIGFRTYPLQFYLFKDGLFIRSAPREFATLVGAKVVKIGNATVEQALASVRNMIGRDNEMGVKFFAPFLLAMPEVLQALGIIANMENGTFTFRVDGQESVVAMKPYGPAPLFAPDTDTSWLSAPGWTDARNNSRNPAPLWLKEPKNNFWFEYLPSQKIIFAQINQVGNKEHQTLEQFADSLSDFITMSNAEKLVLDLRLNRGGNGYLNRSILRAVIRSEKIDRQGKFFAIIGRSTWSAAQMLVNDLEKYTNVLFVGEPSGGKVNCYGDSRKIVLPNSGITVRVSTLWWQGDERDDRPWTSPSIPAELTFDEYRSNIDPALREIMNYSPARN